MSHCLGLNFSVAQRQELNRTKNWTAKWSELDSNSDGLLPGNITAIPTYASIRLPCHGECSKEMMGSRKRGCEDTGMLGCLDAWMLGWLDGWVCAIRATWQRGAKGHPAHPWTRASQNMTWHEPFRLFFLFPFYSCPSAGQTNFSTVFRCDPWVKYYVTRRTQRKRWQPSRYD